MSKKKLPQTSVDALKSLEPDKIRLMYQKIELALLELRSGTYEQISQFLNEKPERIWKRLSEGASLNLWHRTAERRVMSSGRSGFVWKPGKGEDEALKKKKLAKSPTVIDFSKVILNQPKPSQQIQESLFNQ